MAENDDMDRYLEERRKLDSMFEEKFTKIITVMFTDLKGSTAIAEAEGDMVSRMLIKSQSDILLPAIKDNNGVFVKAIGDGSLSYFDHAQDAVRAAVRIQREMDALNMAKTYKFPVLMRVGLHTGKCVVEANDIFGDVVNTASRFESAAEGGGILMSEDSYNALSDHAEIYCRFFTQVTLKGKKELYNAYKAFWNPQEIELDKKNLQQAAAPKVAAPARSSGLRVVVLAGGLVVLVLAITLGLKFFGPAHLDDAKRSINDTVATPAASHK